MLSQRRAKFQRLLIAAEGMDTDWLIANVRDYRPERDVSRLSLLACLRIIARRTQSGAMVYRDRMRATKQFVFSR